MGSVRSSRSPASDWPSRRSCNGVVLSCEEVPYFGSDEDFPNPSSRRGLGLTVLPCRRSPRRSSRSLLREVTLAPLARPRCARSTAVRASARCLRKSAISGMTKDDSRSSLSNHALVSSLLTSLLPLASSRGLSRCARSASLRERSAPFDFQPDVGQSAGARVPTGDPRGGRGLCTGTRPAGTCADERRRPAEAGARNTGRRTPTNRPFRLFVTTPRGRRSHRRTARPAAGTGPSRAR